MISIQQSGAALAFATLCFTGCGRGDTGLMSPEDVVAAVAEELGGKTPSFDVKCDSNASFGGGSKGSEEAD